MPTELGGICEYSQFDFSNFAVPTFLGLAAPTGAIRGGRSARKPHVGPKLDQALTKTIKIGVRVKAVGGPCKGIVCHRAGSDRLAGAESENRRRRILSPGVHQMTYRTLERRRQANDRADSQLPAGEEVHALVTFEITRYSVDAAGGYVDLQGMCQG